MLGYGAQPVWAVHGDVGVGAHEHAEVPVKGLHPPDGLGRGHETVQRGNPIPIVSFLDDPGQGVRQEIDQVGGYADRTGTRAAAAVRGGEGLMQVVVQHVETQVAGTDDAEQGVHVGAVAVHQPAGAVYQLDDCFDV